MAREWLALDLGAGNVKLKGAAGGVVLASQAATVLGEVSGRAVGLRAGKPPLRVRLNGHAFYVGVGAHDWGRPVENLDDGRFVVGSPELRALTYGALVRYEQEFGLPEEAALMVGLPQSALSDEATRGIRGWLAREHSWHADGVEGSFRVPEVTVTSQAAGALFGYFLDEAGAFVPERKGQFKQEVGIISIGMGTVEMLVVRNGIEVKGFTKSFTGGVRRLLDLVDPQGYYSRGELDTLLRAGKLDVKASLPVWWSEVAGGIEKRWGRAFRRFAVIIVVGGGAVLLLDALTGQFVGKAFVPDDPVLAIAEGLYRMALMREARRRR